MAMPERPGLSPMHEKIAGAVARRHARIAGRIPVLDMADLRQEALLAIWTREIANPDDPAGATLAYEVARNACINAVRRARGAGRGRRLDVAASTPLAFDPGSPAPDPATAADVRDAIGRLTPALATAAERRLAGWSHAEAAGADSCSPKTVETRINRAFRDLRVALAAYAPDAEAGSP